VKQWPPVIACHRGRQKEGCKTGKDRGKMELDSSIKKGARISKQKMAAEGEKIRTSGAESSPRNRGAKIHGGPQLKTITMEKKKNKEKTRCMHPAELQPVREGEINTNNVV